MRILIASPLIQLLPLQASNIKEYSECLGPSWKLTTSRTRLKEVQDIDFSLCQHSDLQVSPLPWLHYRFRVFSTANLILCVLPGNDPLTDDESNHDINSVAGVLKLYFRGLENPLFPKERFSDLLACISKSTSLLLLVKDSIN